MIRDENGQSLIEMALVVPILLLVVVGIFDIGRMLYAYSDLHFTTQETVRLGSFGRTDLEMIDFAKQNFHAGDSSQLIVHITPSESMRNSGDYVTVTLEYPVQPFTPLVSEIFQNPIVMKSDSTIRIE
jgi:Flp pilus assembly protein TadG